MTSEQTLRSENARSRLFAADKRDLDLNRRALRATRRELARRGHDLTESGSSIC